jgi:hypothetical protein
MAIYLVYLSSNAICIPKQLISIAFLIREMSGQNLS